MELILWLIVVVVLFAAVVVGPLLVVVGLVAGGCSASGTVCECSARCRSEMKVGEWSSPAGNVLPVESISVGNGLPE